VAKYLKHLVAESSKPLPALGLMLDCRLKFNCLITGAIKELIASLPNATAETRASLRSRLRALVKKIDIFAVGRPRVTQEYIEEYIKELKTLLPEVTDNEIRQARLNLTAKINNKKLATCNIYFNSGSIRNLNLYGTIEVPFELDREGGKVISRYKNQEGQKEESIYPGSNLDKVQ
jgi:hypothetical protein